MTENYLDILAETIRNNWDQPALTDFYLTEDGSAQDTSRGNHYTYGEMYAEICRVADLLTALGLQKGDHIAICGANSSHWVIAYLAIAKMQGVSVTVMHSLMPDEIARLVDFSDAKALFVDGDLWEELKSQPMPQVENIISLENFESLASGTSIIVSNASSPSSPSSVSSASNETSASSASSASSPSIVSFPQSNPDDLAMICFTSGTSGSAKGVMLSLGNISNVMQNEVRGFPEDINNKYVTTMPFAHTYGLMTDLLGQLLFKKHIHIPINATGNEIVSILSIVSPYAFVTIPMVLTKLYTRFFEKLPAVLGGKCKQLYVGGASLSREVIDGLLSLGLPYSMGYGLTETCFLISYIQSFEYRYGSCGRICLGMTARISPAGEILVKGENVMLGYYKDPEATAAKIDADGWLHTGDKGHLDEDGYLYVEGRLEQDIIVLPNGENIHPEDIERKINALPEVKESIVLARDGKLVAIAVPQITNDQSPMTNSDLRRIILRNVNPQLPLYSQLYDVEITDIPLHKTEKQTLKRYLYK